MNTGFKPLAVWGLAVCGVAVLGVIVFGLGALPALLLAAAGAGGILTALAVRWMARAGDESPGPVIASAAPETSGPTVLVAIGATTMLVGAVFGQAFLFPGGGLVVLGLAAVVAERRAMRRLIAGATPNPTDVGKTR